LTFEVKILLAPNAYKESLSAQAVAQAMAQGIRKVMPSAQIIKLPIADGGDGTLEVLVQLTRGKLLTKTITNPLGTRSIVRLLERSELSLDTKVPKDVAQPTIVGSIPLYHGITSCYTLRIKRNCQTIKARWGLLGRGKKTAVIEMAEAAGIRLIPPPKRNPLITHTYGVGELIKAALDRNVKRVIIGLGGSATVEAGTGLVRALGIKFLDRKWNEISLGGGALKHLAHIDISNLDPRVRKTEFIAAYDVVTPLVGPKGAAHTFGPQKGANKREVAILEHNLKHLARIIQQDLGINVRNIKGGGAAGGMGAGLCAFLGAKLISGTELFLNIAEYKRQLKGVDLVLTGEGKLDGTTVLGKAPIVLAQITKKISKVPVIAICGSIGLGADKVLTRGINAYFGISSGNISRARAIKNAASLIEETTREIMGLL